MAEVILAGNNYLTGLRQINLNVPEDSGDGLGFRLTRTLWDPYPWVREVTPGSIAEEAGLKVGDCLMHAAGKDLLGLPVSQVASLIRGDGGGGEVSLLAWNCGVDPKDDPELLWSVGGSVRGEHSRKALEGVVRALACSVCNATVTRGLSCARSHLYCEGCWQRLERCALCRESLPPKDSPYAKNLVAEQVFEAIAAEYNIKGIPKNPTKSVSAYTTPVVSPNMSPASLRRGQYKISMLNRKKTVQFHDRMHHNYHSDPNLLRTATNEITIKRERLKPTISTNSVENSTRDNPEVDETGGKIVNNMAAENIDEKSLQNGKLTENESNSCCKSGLLEQKLLKKLQTFCLMDLNSNQCCGLSRPFNSSVNCNELCCKVQCELVDSKKKSCSTSTCGNYYIPKYNNNIVGNYLTDCSSPVLGYPVLQTLEQ